MAEQQIALPRMVTELPLSRWLMRTFRRTLPLEDLAHDPLLRYEIRAVRWVVDEADLQTRTLKRLRAIVGGFVGIWAALAVLLLLDPDHNAYLMITNMIAAIGYAGLFDKFILDFVAILNNMNVISDDIENGRWDLIRLTDVQMREVVRTKHAAAQLRVWKTMVNVIGSRLAVVVLLPLHFYLLPLLVSDDLNIYSPLEHIRLRNIYDALTLIFVHCILFTMAFVYVVEPRWRVRALTAASIEISSRAAKHGMNILWGLEAFFTLWIAQILFFIGASFLGSAFSFAAYADGYGYSSRPMGEADITFAFFVYALIVSAIIYGFYHRLMRRNIRRAVRFLAQHDKVL